MFATYHAQQGDSQEVEYFGLKLKDGESVEVPNDHEAVKRRGNPTIEISDARPGDNAPRRGRLPDPDK